jgi:hypothetical protein
LILSFFYLTSGSLFPAEKDQANHFTLLLFGGFSLFRARGVQERSAFKDSATDSDPQLDTFGRPKPWIVDYVPWIVVFCARAPPPVAGHAGMAALASDEHR